MGSDPKLKRMIELDVNYMRLENEYMLKWVALHEEYTAQQKPLLDERKTILKKGEIASFWLQALNGHPVFSDEIQEWDKPVLAMLTDIRTESLPDPTGKNERGFRIIFEWDYPEGSPEADQLPFKNKTLSRIYETGLENEFLTEITVKKIKMEKEIDWKPARDITVEIKKSKNEKKKLKTERIERASFFRLFFRTISMDEPDLIKDLLDKSLLEMGFDSNDIDDEEELEQAYEDSLEKVSDDAYEMGLCLRDNIIPFAVRWYTGEACPLDKDDDDDDDEDEGDGSDENEEDSENDKDAIKKGEYKAGENGDTSP